MEQWQLLFGAFLLLLGEGTVASEISHEKSTVFGPGVDPKRSSFPVNYFYVQAVDRNGNNFTNVDENNLVVDFESPQKFRYRREHFNLGGGLFLYMYRAFSEIPSLTIHVNYKEKPLARSPYHLGPLMHENCACPLRTASQWLGDFNCPAVEPQISYDLKAFKDGVNVEELYDKAASSFSSSSWVHYSIVDGKLYARTFGSIVGFKFLSNTILLSIVNKVWLPDMELIVNLGDWPLSKVRKSSQPFPMFSWCGSEDTWDIVWPTWDLMKSTISGMDRVTLSILTAQRSLGQPWEDREPRAFFRGRDSNQARLDLIKDHHKNTELFDVGITAWFFFKHDENVYGPKAERVGFHDFFKYKYQINIDGTVAAYRLPYLLAGGSLVLKQDSSYYEHFYHMLKPWVHYVPLHRNISNLVRRLEWARENDEMAKEMAINSARFVQQNLLPEHIYCYMVRLLRDYGRLMKGTPKVHAGMEPVVPEVAHECTEFCREIQPRKKLPKEEL